MVGNAKDSIELFCRLPESVLTDEISRSCVTRAISDVAKELRISVDAVGYSFGGNLEHGREDFVELLCDHFRWGWAD